MDSQSYETKMAFEQRNLIPHMMQKHLSELCNNIPNELGNKFIHQKAEPC